MNEYILKEIPVNYLYPNFPIKARKRLSKILAQFIRQFPLFSCSIGW